MGRPKGVKNGQGTTHGKNLTRKKWKPKHTMMVYLSASGHYSNEQIAEHFGCSPVTVSQILNTRQAGLIFQEYQDNLRTKLGSSIDDKILELADTGVRKLAETINADLVVGTDSKKHQDNVVLQILKGTGHLDREKESGQKDKAAPLSERLASRLITALEKSNEAEEILRLSRGEIKEADYTIEADEGNNSNRKEA